MRGTRLMLRRLVLDDGIIPAYAGNTTNAFRHIRDHRDHPRVCGEHALLHAMRNPVRGSSPRMRGTPTAVVVCHLVRGIIPAYAGNTIQLILSDQSADNAGIIPAYAGNTFGNTSFTSDIKDHPRVCGEHELQTGGSVEVTGSSPRMRGTLR